MKRLILIAIMIIGFSIEVSAQTIQSVAITDSTCESFSWEVSISYPTQYITFDSLRWIKDADSTVIHSGSQTVQTVQTGAIQSGTFTGLTADSLYEDIRAQVFFHDSRTGTALTTLYSDVVTMTTLELPVLTNLTIIDSTYKNATYYFNYADSGNPITVWDSLKIIDCTDSSTNIVLFPEFTLSDTSGVIQNLTASTKDTFQVILYVNNNAIYSTDSLWFTTTTAPALSNFLITDSTYNSASFSIDTAMYSDGPMSKLEIVMAADSSVHQTFTTTSGWITGLTNNTTYSFRARMYDNDDSLITTYSDADGVITFRIESIPIEPKFSDGTLQNTRALLSKATVWEQNYDPGELILFAATYDDTINFTDSTSRDTSAIYNSWEQTGIMIFADQASDSTEFEIILWSGNAINDSIRVMTPVDTFNTTDDIDNVTGFYYDNSLGKIYIWHHNLPLGQHFYYEFMGRLGMGTNTKLYDSFVIRRRY